MQGPGVRYHNLSSRNFLKNFSFLLINYYFKKNYNDKLFLRNTIYFKMIKNIHIFDYFKVTSNFYNFTNDYW